MTDGLQSYSEGRWQDGRGEQRPPLDAATGEVVATIPARGPDVAAMLAHARPPAARNSAGSVPSGTTCSGPRCRAIRTCWPG